jgi:hypothetical protein
MTPPTTSQHHKILGMIFDDKLQWGKHVKHVKARTIKQLNLLKCLSGLRWGADQDILLKALIVSVIEYGIWIYKKNHPRKAQLKVYELHWGLSGPRIENILCEAGSSTWDHRWLLITEKTAIRSMTIQSKVNWITKPFHIRAMDATATLNIDYQRIRQYYTTFRPPYLKQIRPDTEMLSCRPSDNNDVRNAAFRK